MCIFTKTMSASEKPEKTQLILPVGILLQQKTILKSFIAKKIKYIYT